MARSFAAVLALIAMSTVAQAKEMTCPDPATQFTKDWSGDAQTAIGALGKLKAGELAVRAKVVTQPLFDKVPNSDRVVVAQSLISLFCQFTARSSELTDAQKLDRLDVFSAQMMSFIIGKVAPVTHGPTNVVPRTTPVSPAAHPASDLEKYVDTAARRSPDKKNVVVSFLDYDGVDVRSLEGTARQTLRERGYNVVSLFRGAFTRDEVGRTLFSGNASVATRLQLGKRCDSVLLVRLRLAGPVSNLNGLYLSEWVLEIHSIDPDSGDVRDRRELGEKGAGASPEASKADALRRLQASIESELAVWSWT